MEETKTRSELLFISPPELVVRGIRKCWLSDEGMDSSNGALGPNDDKLVRRIISHKHTSTLEHSLITFDVGRISRACFDDKTEILTKNGFVFFKDLKRTDEVATLNPKTKNIEYHIPDEHIEYNYDGEMVVGKSTKFNFKVTPNHKMYVSRGYGIGSKKTKIKDRDYEFINAKEMIGETGKFYNSSEWMGEIPNNLFDIPASSFNRNLQNGSIDKRDATGHSFEIKNFLRFVGRYISDGCCDNDGKGHYRINITDSKDEIKNIEEIIKKMDFKYSICEKNDGNVANIKFHDKTLHDWVSMNIKKGSKNKQIPREFLTYNKEHLLCLYEGIIEGDGYRRDGFQDSITTASKQLADDIQELVIKLGKSARVRRVSRETNFGHFEGFIVEVISEKYNMPRFNARRSEEHNIKTEHYRGVVRCINVKNHIIYCRREGLSMWFGNCLQEVARHRIGIGISVESTRYTLKRVINGENIKTLMVSTGDDCIDQMNIDHMKDLIHYLKSSEETIGNDVAKYGIPENYPVTMVWSFNFRSFRHFLQLRTNKAAHFEIRNLAHELYDLIPKGYGAFFDEVVTPE